jgi:hypothetical protein
MCGHLTGASTSSDPCRHLHLQQNLQRAQTCTVVRSSWSEGHSCLATAFCSFSFFFFFMHCTFFFFFSHEVFPLSSFFQCFILICIVQWVPNMALLSGPIHHVHPSSVQGGVGDITHSPRIIFLSLIVQC